MDKERLVEFINDAIRRAKMRRNFSDKKLHQATQDAYVRAMEDVLHELQKPSHDRRYANPDDQEAQA